MKKRFLLLLRDVKQGFNECVSLMYLTPLIFATIFALLSLSSAMPLALSVVVIVYAYMQHAVLAGQVVSLLTEPSLSIGFLFVASLLFYLLARHFYRRAKIRHPNLP